MNQDSTADVFRRRLEEAREAERARAFPMEFEGFPCRVRPLGLLFFIRAGMMPEYLTRQVIANSASDSVSGSVLPESPAEMVAGEVFMRQAFCAVMDEPQVVEVEPVPEGGYLFANLQLSAPKFVAAVMTWIKKDCPMPAEEKGEGVLGVADLERFPDSAGGNQALMLGIRARAAGRQPAELLPPIENELAESDLNDAVTLALYLFEQKRESEERKWAEWRERTRNRELAYMIVLARVGEEVPAIPLPGEESPADWPGVESCEAVKDE